MFQTVGVLGRLGTPQAVASVRALLDVLRGAACTVVTDRRTAQAVDGVADWQVLNRAELGPACDLAIVVGGDGSMLAAARQLVDHGVPLLGVNRGALGFLADISPADIATRVQAVLAGDHAREERFLLSAEVRHGDTVTGRGLALNDVVLHPGSMSRMLEFALHVDGEFVYDQRSDGLIISTPTGSTAYALSAGGPIMHPTIDALVVVPMFPHTLTSRPLVLPAASTLTLQVGYSSSDQPAVSCDSQLDLPVNTGDVLTVRTHPQRLQLLHPPGHSFYEACRSKLDWASRLGGRHRPRNGDGGHGA